MYLFSVFSPSTGTWLVGTFECILHLWLARDSYALSTSLRWEQDHYALPLELLKFVAQLFTGWCLSGCVAAAAALVSISKNQNSVSAVRLFGRYELIDLSIHALFTGAVLLTVLVPGLRGSAVSLMCTQAQQMDSGWHMGRWAAEDCAEDFEGDWTWPVTLLCLGLAFKAYCVAVVRRCCHESARKVVLEAAAESTAGDPYSEQEPGVMLLDSDMDNSQDSQTTIQPPSDASKKV